MFWLVMFVTCCCQFLLVLHRENTVSVVTVAVYTQILFPHSSNGWWIFVPWTTFGYLQYCFSHLKEEETIRMLVNLHRAPRPVAGIITWSCGCSPLLCQKSRNVSSRTSVIFLEIPTKHLKGNQKPFYAIFSKTGRWKGWSKSCVI